MRLTPLVMLLALTACAGAGPTVHPGAEPAALRSDEGIAEPASGWWAREAAGRWRYDLGAGGPADVQLTGTEGRGLLRVSLPEGAVGARVVRLAVTYTRDGDAPDAAAAGSATWRFLADRGGLPGATLATLPVVVGPGAAVPFEGGGAPVIHAVPDVEVPARFWLEYTVQAGEPRVGGARVAPTEGAGFHDLFFMEGKIEPPGRSVDARPLVALEVVDLGR